MTPTVLLFCILILPGLLLTLVAYLALDKLPQPLGKSAEPKNKAEQALPFISILVAARNEARHLPACLQALAQLNYPGQRMEILIGSDDSSDNTLAIARAWSKGVNHAQVYDIGPDFKSNTRGKARVLSYLTQRAKGDYYLITDADCCVSPDWARTLVAYHLEGNDCVTGTTCILNNGTFSMIQAIDWRYFMSLVHSFGAIGMPITAVGNNMSVCAQAYNGVGGYESIPFSVTEDFKLFAALLKKGARFVGIIEPGAKVASQPQPNIRSYLLQRKRWLTGAMGLRLPTRLMLAGLPAWYLGVIGLALMGAWNWVVSLALFRLIWVYWHQKKVSGLLNVKPFRFFQTLLYEASMYWLIPLTLLYFILPGKVVWKGRKL